MTNTPQTGPTPEVLELLELLNDARKLGITFYVGNAYISRAYIDQQTALVERIRQANIAHGYKPGNRYGEARN